ncbi:hydroxymethylbilane synthase [Actinocatenispora rupis]|uniref:Porphobilinogen deaminase n=1 Tax=Actinocatenispora rupis TaxID=519421 RepID=A0A8J3JB90_9ACTN|nr:hydroxymethylbilane synthase [Actinocatenispora rupis]GID13599.1 porphobilinogen deaminase 1 [Actinocatenispora rupis]
MARPVRLGTRGSKLAVAQSGTVADALRSVIDRPVELIEVVTPGDRSSAPVRRLGVGVFVSALRDALAAGEIDVAVHSYKDLPTAPAEGLTIAAVPPRADARDVLVSASGLPLAELPAGARVGTGAPRRMAQLNALGADLTCVPIRGNVDTRLRKLTAGELDAVVLAAAGLQRLGRIAEATEFLDPDLVLPAPAQGALAVECRTTDAELVSALATLDDASTRAAVRAERALLAALEAGCSAPVGGYATVADGAVFLRGAVATVDGSTSIRRSGTGTLADAESVGRRLAAELLDAGADSLLESAR